jgi:hypothetical protein
MNFKLSFYFKKVKREHFVDCKMAIPAPSTISLHSCPYYDTNKLGISGSHL